MGDSTRGSVSSVGVLWCSVAALVAAGGAHAVAVVSGSLGAAVFAGRVIVAALVVAVAALVVLVVRACRVALARRDRFEDVRVPLELSAGGR